MNYKLGLIIGLSFALSACATSQPQRCNYNRSQSSLAEASYSVSRSIVELAETAQAAHPMPCMDPPPSPASYNMGGITSVDWSGPIEPLLKQIAYAADYRLRVLGTEPAIPVLVTIYAKNQMLGDILRDASFQTGRRAAVIVYPGSRVIELRYAKN